MYVIIYNPDGQIKEEHTGSYDKKGSMFKWKDNQREIPIVHFKFGGEEKDIVCNYNLTFPRGGGERIAYYTFDGFDENQIPRYSQIDELDKIKKPSKDAEDLTISKYLGLKDEGDDLTDKMVAQPNVSNLAKYAVWFILVMLCIAMIYATSTFSGSLKTYGETINSSVALGVKHYDLCTNWTQQIVKQNAVCIATLQNVSLRCGSSSMMGVT